MHLFFLRLHVAFAGYRNNLSRTTANRHMSEDGKKRITQFTKSAVLNIELLMRRKRSDPWKAKHDLCSVGDAFATRRRREPKSSKKVGAKKQQPPAPQPQQRPDVAQMLAERARQDEAARRRYETALADAGVAHGDGTANHAVLWSDDNVSSWSTDAAPSDRAFSRKAFGL